MRKTYIEPTTIVVSIETAHMVNASGVVSDQGIKYGGVDEDGTRNPDSRRQRDNVWDEEELSVEYLLKQRKDHF